MLFHNLYIYHFFYFRYIVKFPLFVPHYLSIGMLRAAYSNVFPVLITAYRDYWYSLWGNFL